MHDVIIIGGGLNGLTLGIALAGAGVDTAIIEASDPAAMQDDRFDGRVSAIANASKQIFEGIGLWQDIAPHAGPIDDIRITDGNSPLFLHYDHALVGDEPMGWIVENRHLRRPLFAHLKRHKDHLTFLAPMRHTAIETDSHGVTVTLEDGTTLRAKLLVAADGRRSSLREQAGIKTIEVDYKQAGIVCTIRHEKSHRRIAQERFLPAGPFAVLPMQSEHHSSLVWTEKAGLAPLYMQMNETDFIAAVAERTGDYLGKLEEDGPRWCYPLSLTFARDYTAPRMALIGDAAHAIHPIAGQGYNLGMRDIAALAELIVDTKRLGLDVGGETVLSRYNRLRRLDNLLMIAATDSLNRLFSNNITPIKLARDVGLAAVNRIPPLKQYFMRHAMGVAGEPPRLVRGEAL